MNLIFFIGMPAVGKTFWGSKVAAKHNYNFIDLDGLVEEREQMDISAIFAKHGQEGFRAIEHTMLQEVIDKNLDKTIIASGGGTPCYQDNIFLMKQSGCVVYLKAGIEILLKNLQEDLNDRPLLQNRENVEEYLENLLTDRSSFYELADFIVPVDNLSLANFDEIISLCTNRR